MCKNTWVYVMAQRGGGWAIKIGIAREPDTRLRQVQIGNPRPLYLAHAVGPVTSRNARIAEKIAHDVLADFRMARLLNLMWEAVEARG